MAIISGLFPQAVLTLSGATSLFQRAVERVKRLGAEDIEVGQTLIVTNEEHRFLALEQLREILSLQATLLLEPVGRNTAPAITLAALQAAEIGQDPILVVTPADQTVQNDAAFTVALQKSIRVAAGGGVVVLGVAPEKPETGYGYIKQVGNAGSHGEYKVAQFAEKPTLEGANSYLAAGEYTWNSGIFVLRASTWLKALNQFRPDILSETRAAWSKKLQTHSLCDPTGGAFAKVPSESIDYAVMEKCTNTNIALYVVPLDAGWSDLGAWDAVWQANKDDQHYTQGNVTHGDTLLVQTHDTFVRATSRLVTAVGVCDLIIVETSDAVLVTNRCQSKDVKKLVRRLESQKRKDLNLHRKVHRSWGWYDSIDEGERFKVKRIQVKPGGSLSLQKHHHRAEHWIVVKGTAEITNGDKLIMLTENQSTYIPLGGAPISELRYDFA